MKKIIALLLACTLLLLSTACAHKVRAQNLMEGVEKSSDKASAMPSEALEPLYQASLSLINQIECKENENLVFSPVSVFYCLGLVANGAGGNTLAQLEAFFGVDRDTLNRTMEALSLELENSRNVSWNVANSIWFKDRNLTVQPNFLQKNADYYAAQAYAAPFDASTCEDINAWCKEQTNGMISHILDEIPPEAYLYLINAICFEGQWAVEYEKRQIRPGTFTDALGNEIETDMLHSRENIYLETDTFTGFCKDYRGGEYSFVGLLPKEGTTPQQLLRSLTAQQWKSLMFDPGGGTGSRIYHIVDVAMPEFKAENSIALREYMEQLGVTDLFDGALADLTPMGSCADGNLYCSRLQQGAFIEVDRNGTKAAAVTFSEVSGESAMEPVEHYSVVLDRPFVYAIVDNSTGLPIFLGITQNVA